jgi:hypothetical protein
MRTALVYTCIERGRGWGGLLNSLARLICKQWVALNIRLIDVVAGRIEMDKAQKE